MSHKSRISFFLIGLIAFGCQSQFRNNNQILRDRFNTGREFNPNQRIVEEDFERSNKFVFHSEHDTISLYISAPMIHCDSVLLSLCKFTTNNGVLDSMYFSIKNSRMYHGYPDLFFTSQGSNGDCFLETFKSNGEEYKQLGNIGGGGSLRTFQKIPDTISQEKSTYHYVSFSPIIPSHASTSDFDFNEVILIFDDQSKPGIIGIYYESNYFFLPLDQVANAM